MRVICRVPLQLFTLRLSILYLRTCVGLRYGRLNTIILYLNNNLVNLSVLTLIS
jgi:hypothetical protein